MPYPWNTGRGIMVFRWQVEVKDQINSGSIAFAYNFFVFRDFQILFVLQSVTNLVNFCNTFRFLS
jgi:hypothetical protein